MVKKEELMPYFQRAKVLMSMFTDLNIQHVIRSHNQKADALGGLAASMSLTSHQMMDVRVEECRILPILVEEETMTLVAMTADVYEIEVGDW